MRFTVPLHRPQYSRTNSLTRAGLSSSMGLLLRRAAACRTLVFEIPGGVLRV